MIRLILLVIILVGSFLSFQYLRANQVKKIVPSPAQISNLLPSPSPKIILVQPEISKVIPGRTHVFQTFNNCGPAALSMALSYYDKNITQEELGLQLRPFQVPGGDNDDKSVTLEELAEKSKEYGFIPFHRPNGNIELMKMFITYDLPIITRTLLKENEDIGHYRVIRGYDDLTNELIQDDSMQGKNLRYSFTNFNSLWKKFNYEYLVLVPGDMVEIAEAILGEDIDPKISWQKAVENSQKDLENNPSDLYARFNLSIALYHIGDYQGSIQEFEKVKNDLPFRTLWYQIEPVQAYFAVGDYTKVFEITDQILNYHNRAFSELYLLRGESYLNMDQKDLARAEFEKAVFYNQNLQAARSALENL
ncbi:C39 family peptidase [Candidatus Daviesbacteria bacterium]|nr:C39 family peptidase [Candidatus Daviesbacteria bacterium]